VSTAALILDVYFTAAVTFPNTPDPDEIGRALDTIFDRYPELPTVSVAHVFGEHSTQQFGDHDVVALKAPSPARKPEAREPKTK
jgi:hypothetical protein